MSAEEVCTLPSSCSGRVRTSSADCEPVASQHVPYLEKRKEKKSKERKGKERKGKERKEKNRTEQQRKEKNRKEQTRKGKE